MCLYARLPARPPACLPASCMHACMDGWTDGWTDGWMDVYMYVCMCIYIYIHIYPHTHVFLHSHLCSCAYTFTYSFVVCTSFCGLYLYSCTHAHTALLSTSNPEATPRPPGKPPHGASAVPGRRIAVPQPPSGFRVWPRGFGGKLRLFTRESPVRKALEA